MIPRHHLKGVSDKLENDFDFGQDWKENINILWSLADRQDTEKINLLFKNVKKNDFDIG